MTGISIQQLSYHYSEERLTTTVLLRHANICVSTKQKETIETINNNIKTQTNKLNWI
jgi:hypothetical protein